MIETIASVVQPGASLPAAQALAGIRSSGTLASSFGNVFDQHLGKVNADLARAEKSLQQLASGEQVELHDVMISLETARISVQTLIQVRNRLVEAYQDVMRMQV